MSSCFAAVAPHRSRFLLLAIGLISLVVVVLAVQTSSQVRALEDPVEVTAEDVPDLIDEINAANGRTEPTIITLTPSEYLLTASYNNEDTGLPDVSGDIMIEGNGATIRRDSSSPFRILYVVESGTLTLNRVTISGGDPGEFTGGGIINDRGELTLTNSTVTGNEAGISGGGIYTRDGALTLINSTVSGNEAGISGGGIFNRNGDLTLTNSTVSGNAADYAGGIYNIIGDLTLTNSIVWGNQGYDVLEDGVETTSVNHAILGSGNIPCEASNNCSDANPPLFVDAEPASSAPTTEGDYRLQSTSPAIDAGSLSLYESTFDGDVVETDLDGNSRLSGANIDLGAYEFQQDPNIDRIYVDASNTDVLQSGVSWDRAFSDLQDGLALAEASLQSANIDQVDIFVAGGTYYPAPEGSQDRNATFTIPDGVTIYGGFAGDEPAPLDVLDQRNLDTNKTTLSGDIDRNGELTGDNVYTVVTVEENVTATIDGVTITGGNADDNSAPTSQPPRNGGGIHVSSGTVTLTNSSISGNSAASDGGGIYSDSGGVTITDSTVSGNEAFDGGGIHIAYSDLILTNSTVSGNWTSNHAGGIYNNNSDVVLTNSVVSGNEAVLGGGIYNHFSDLILTNSTVTGNFDHADAGGIRNGSGDVTLTNSILWGNRSQEFLGGFGSGNVSNSIIGGECPTGSTNCSTGNPLFANWIDPSEDGWDPTSGGDYRLEPGSPAIDTGSESAYNDSFDNGAAATDRGGNDRVVGDDIDLGAYEAQFTVDFELEATPNTVPLGGDVDVSITISSTGHDSDEFQGLEVDFSGPDGDETLTFDSQGEATTSFTADTAGDVEFTAAFRALEDDLTVTVASEPALSLPPDRTLTYLQRNNVNWDATATDWAGNDIDVTCDPESGSDFSVGTTTVTCEATDSLGQTATGSFTVTVQPEPEPDAPQIRNVPDTIVAFPVSPAGVPVDYPMPHAVDPTDGDIPVTCDPPPGSWFGVGHNTVTCSATNSLEMTTTVTFGISVAPFDSADFGHLDDIANAWFWAVWARTDLPVRDGHALRSWMWGEGPFTTSIWEPYTPELQNPGGDPVFLNIPDSEREVIYFDKARMEINDPDADPDDLWTVTNGLLVIEMITGNRQFGDDLFIEYEPSQGNVAGDADDTNGPTYAALQNVLDEPAQPVGTLLTREIDREGDITDDPAWGDYGVEIGQVDDVTEHGIAGPFWEFMNSEGTVYEDGELFIDDLFQNAYYATGRPVTEPYWANVQVGGEMRDVLIQCFERRCLTYTPGNSEGFIVEAGNVGQHYYQWRYIQAPD